MTSSAIKPASRFLASGAGGAAAWVMVSLMVMVTGAQAQQIFRSVAADGKVTYSDKPPAQATSKASIGAGGPGDAGSSALPFELRQVVSKYPVTLYTGDNCAPCASARTLLTGRGIPFTEKSVNTADDVQALQRLSSDNTLPFGTIGSQQLKGFSDSEWTQFLNAAGYPAASVLPPSYRRPAVTPLVAVVTAPAAAAAPATAGATNAAPARPATAAPAPATSNPSGIRF